MATILRQSELTGIDLPGRVIHKAVGKDGPVVSKKMTVGFAEYSAKSGPMEPHHHAEETIFVVAAQNGSFRHGEERDRLGEPIALQAGMIIHFDELEWHVFEYGEGGYVKIIFIYGQVDRIRPEEME